MSVVVFITNTFYKCAFTTLVNCICPVFQLLNWVQIARVAASADEVKECAYTGAHLPLKVEAAFLTCGW